MSLQPSESPEEFSKQLQILFSDAALEVNGFLFWAEKAQGHARHASGDQAITWYRNAMQIYDFLERKTQQPFISRIYMRLNVIELYGYGNEKSRPYLDEIIDWIVSGLQADVEQVKTEANRWMQLPVERIRELRMLNMKLKIARKLEENGIKPDNNALDYFPLIDVLP